MKNKTFMEKLVDRSKLTAKKAAKVTREQLKDGSILNNALEEMTDEYMDKIRVLAYGVTICSLLRIATDTLDTKLEKRERRKAREREVDEVMKKLERKHNKADNKVDRE